MYSLRILVFVGGGVTDTTFWTPDDVYTGYENQGEIPFLHP